MPHLKFVKGFGFNRKHFHASNALISCIQWVYDKKFDDNKQERKKFPLELFEINKFNQLERYIAKENIIIAKTYTNPNFYFKCKEQDGAFTCLSNNGSAPKTGLGCLYSILQKTGRKDEFYLNSENYYSMLPVYIAQLTFDRNKWYNNDNTLRSADRKNDYLESEELLRRSFIFTCLYRNDHITTDKDARGNLVLNQLCFDTNTIASKKLKNIFNSLDDRDIKLIERWNKVISLARTATKVYKANYKYGVYQIMNELDTYIEIQKGINVEKKYDNPNLHNNINELNKEVKKYYEELIEPLLFKYELIK